MDYVCPLCVRSALPLGEERGVPWDRVTCLILGLGSVFGDNLKPIVVVVESRRVCPGRIQPIWYE